MRLTKATFKDGQTVPGEPVWLNPWGVNSIEGSRDGQATWVRMDDGCGYLVVEAPQTIVKRIKRGIGGAE